MSFFITCVASYMDVITRVASYMVSYMRALPDGLAFYHFYPLKGEGVTSNSRIFDRNTIQIKGILLYSSSYPFYLIPTCEILK